MSRFAVVAGLLYVAWLVGYAVLAPSGINRDALAVYGVLPALLPFVLIGLLVLAARIARRLHL